MKKENAEALAANRKTREQNALLRASAVHLNLENRRLLRKIREVLKKKREA